MKKICIILTTMLLSMLLTGCQCEHEWAEAACDTPKTCTKCGETEGEALGHTWVEATCAEAKHCTLCGKAEGELLAHSWVDATCAEAKHCSVCGKTEGEPLEHTLTEANYQEAAKCTVCGAVVGEPLEAYFEKYGIECNVELGKPYAYENPAPKNPEKIVKGQYMFHGENYISPDDSLEELEGYEWKQVQINLSVPKSELEYSARSWSTFMGDYYKGDEDEEITIADGEQDTFTVNWYGQEYSECKVQYSLVLNQVFHYTLTDKTEWSYQVKWAVRVPIGYDGVVVGVYQMTPEKQDFIDNHPYETHLAAELDGNSLVYRMK